MLIVWIGNGALERLHVCQHALRGQALAAVWTTTSARLQVADCIGQGLPWPDESLQGARYWINDMNPAYREERVSLHKVFIEQRMVRCEKLYDKHGPEESARQYC